MTFNRHLRLNSYAFVLFPIEFKCASNGFFLFCLLLIHTPHGVIRSEKTKQNIWKWKNMIKNNFFL